MTKPHRTSSRAASESPCIGTESRASSVSTRVFVRITMQCNAMQYARRFLSKYRKLDVYGLDTSVITLHVIMKSNQIIPIHPSIHLSIYLSIYPCMHTTAEQTPHLRTFTSHPGSRHPPNSYLILWSPYLPTYLPTGTYLSPKCRAGRHARRWLPPGSGGRDEARRGGARQWSGPDWTGLCCAGNVLGMRV